jgi:hypothetical protein
MPENCIYKTIDLVAGEKFVLPPGAEVLYVSDSGAVESSCNTEFEEKPLLCYYMQWAINVDVEGIKTVWNPFLPPPGNLPIVITLPEINNAWDPDDDETDGAIIVTNIGAAGQVIPAGMSCQDFPSIESALASSSINGLVTNRRFNSETRYDDIESSADISFMGNYGDAGYILYGFWFKAIEEIGNTVYVEIQGNSGNTGTPTRYYAQLMDCADYPVTSEIPTSGSGGTSRGPDVSTTTTTTFDLSPFATTTTTTIP